MDIYYRNGTDLVVFENGSFSLFKKNSVFFKNTKRSIRPNFELNINGGKQLFLNENGFSYKGIRQNEDELVLSYECSQKSVLVEVILDFSKGKNVVAQRNVVTNIGTETITMTRFSSGLMEDIGRNDTTLAWYDNKNLKIHLCHNKWQGEGQWKSYSPQDLGLYPVTTHGWERESFRIQSVGSWSTANFYPLIIIEDSRTGQCWFMELEGSHTWMIKIASYGGYVEPQLTIEATGCDESVGGWFYDLKPGEQYSAERVFWGTVMGGFETAVAELNEVKRNDSLIQHPQNIPPLVFNDYMDCVWGNQKPELILPLAEKAAKLGCEIFCIDGGWYENVNGPGLGDWLPKKAHYGQIPLETVITRIHELGMIPGIWFEWEACSDTAAGFTLDEECILKRYGQPVGETRCFYSFKSRKVRDYLKEKVRCFYDLGVRYIKNDYNQSLGVGCTVPGSGVAFVQGMIENCEAFYEFIDELYEEFPGIVIENCGSGAMRSDNKTLRRFALQSISDQELYRNNPSILMGSLALFPPEKAGIWAYPYPVMQDECNHFQLTDSYVEKMADGRQTVFNMVTGMMGMLYLSGRIDLCDDRNELLIEEAIRIYKKNRHLIPRSRPIYPMGMHSVNEEAVTALGLLSDEKLILAVWNLTKEPQQVNLDLNKWIVNGEIVDIYPGESVEVKLEQEILQCHLEPDAAIYLGIHI